MNKLDESFTQTLQAVQKLIEFFGNQGLFIGGVAVSLLAEPRYTADVDAIIMFDVADVEALLEEAAKHDRAARISNPVAFAAQTRVLLLRHTGDDVNVDISLGALPFEEEAVARAVLYTTEQFSLRLPTVEDLIILKSIAHRPKDMLDIQSLMETYPTLDNARVKRWLQDFAETLEAPEIWDDIAAMFKSNA